MSPSRKQPTQPNELLRFLRIYWIELTAVLAGVAGLALILLEGEELAGLGSGFVETTRQAFSSFTERMRTSLTGNYSPVNLFGFLLVSAALVFILWRIRVRLPRLPRLRASTCPRCGSELHRVRRTPLDRFLTAVFFPRGRRYACSNASCRWSGLLNQRYHHRASVPPPPDT